MFPEVSRFTPELQKEQKQLCIAAGAPVFNSVLYPRLQSFTSVATSLMDQGLVDRIFDFTLTYEENGFSFSKFMQKDPINVTVYVRSVSLSRLRRKGTKGLQRWLESSWIEKDIIINQLRNKQTQ